MQYRKEQTILGQNGIQPVIIILISKNNFDVIVLLRCYALEQAQIFLCAIDCRDYDTEAHVRALLGSVHNSE